MKKELIKNMVSLIVGEALLEFIENPTSPKIVNDLREKYSEKIISAIDSMQEESISVWHNANQQPKMFRKYLVRYSDGSVSGSWERHDDDFIPWKDVVKEHGFTHWCYVEDLLKL